MIKINTSGDYVQLIYVDLVGQSVQQELKSDTDAFECSYDSDGKLFMQFGAMRFENPDPTDFTINGVAVTDAADFISKLNALFTGGGGGATIYTGDGNLSGDRTIDLNGKKIVFKDGDDEWWKVDVAGGQIVSNAYNDAVVPNSANIQQTVGETGAVLNIVCYYNDGEKQPFIQLTTNVTTASIGYTADTHTFNGAIITPNVIALDFADDAAAAIGGVAVGQWYHNAGALRIRRS